MVSVVMPEAAARDLAARWAGLSVAAVNGPAQVVVSGEAGQLAEFEAELSARRVLRWRVPASDFVAHSARVQEIGPRLAAELAGLQPGPGRVRLLSTVTGAWADGTSLDAGYWYANVRQTVRFADAVRVLAADGPTPCRRPGRAPRWAPGHGPGTTPGPPPCSGPWPASTSPAPR